jgi:hypothetical protein
MSFAALRVQDAGRGAEPPHTTKPTPQNTRKAVTYFFRLEESGADENFLLIKKLKADRLDQPLKTEMGNARLLVGHGTF